MKLEIIILAAGQGKRMHSRLPKVLHDLGGRPLLAHALAAAEVLHPAAIHVVYGHGGESVRAAFPAARVRWVHQAEQHGTGHAVRLALAGVDPAALVLVLYGDVPLITTATLRALAGLAGPDRIALLTAELEQPGNYGRILRDANGAVSRIVEHQDATPAQAAAKEINTGFLAAPAARLGAWLAKLTRANAQGEYYLTDIIGMAVAEGVTVATHHPVHVWEILGVNSREELAHLERIHQKNQAEQLMQQGVTLRDPARFDLRGELKCGRDVVIDVNVVIEGKVELGDGVRIGPNNVIRDARIGAGTVVQPNCVIEQAVVGRDCRIGPFARLRPGAAIGDGAHIGNFVEIKQSAVGAGSKVNHLAYVGDATVGKDVNIGAGTITCQLRWRQQAPHPDRGQRLDRLEHRVLVAPVKIGAGATIGAGSVIAKDAPAGELTLTRAEQRTVKGWKRPVKKGKNK